MTLGTDSKLPQHIAIIMDGNGRWARFKNISTTKGHRAGADAANIIVNRCIDLNIPYLTLFAFSSENWLRPKPEVQGLMALFLAVLKRKEIDEFHRRNVRIQFIGNRFGFSAKLQDKMIEVESRTANNTGLTVTVAVDYGGRWDITQAVKSLVLEISNGQLSIDDVTEEVVQKYICLQDKPAPDICIRTGGEKRISNFLLWQFAYTELYFTDCYWPDFDAEQLDLALEDFSLRKRRYGHLPDAAKSG